MRVGLGTGSTVAYLLEALGERELQGRALRGDVAGHRAGGARAGTDRVRVSTSSTSSMWRSTAPTRSTRADGS